MDEIPVEEIATFALRYATIPALLIAVLFGGRGLIWAYGLSWVVSVIWIFSGPHYGGGTGLEGLVFFVILPAFLIAVGFISFFAYAIVMFSGFLPDQRRARRLQKHERSKRGHNRE